MIKIVCYKCGIEFKCNGDGFINRHGDKEICLNKNRDNRCYCKGCSIKSKLFDNEHELIRCYGKSQVFIFR